MCKQCDSIMVRLPDQIDVISSQGQEQKGHLDIVAMTQGAMS